MSPKPKSQIADGIPLKEFRFRFNSPDDTTFIQTLRTAKVNIMGESEKQTRIIEIQSSTSIEKTNDGYSLITTPVSAKLTQDGERIDDPIFSSLQDVVVIYKLNPKGQLLAIYGYESLLKKMKERFPSPKYKAISNVLNNEAIINREKADWNGRIGSFVGKKFRLGDVWQSTDSFDLPSGETVIFYSAIRFAEQTSFEGHDCIRIKFANNSSDKALKDFIGKVSNSVSESLDVPYEKQEMPYLTISGEGERLIDPATMLIYSETMERIVTTSMETPEKERVKFTTKEKKEYRFDYTMIKVL